MVRAVIPGSTVRAAPAASAPTAATAAASATTRTTLSLLRIPDSPCRDDADRGTAGLAVTDGNRCFVPLRETDFNSTDPGVKIGSRAMAVVDVNAAAERAGGRRRQLLAAADRVVRRRGPDASMDEIAAEAGVTKPILYRHFGDKDGLYAALTERYLRMLYHDAEATL